MTSSNKRREAITAYAPLLIWIGVIFILSSGQGSMSRTSLIIRPILEFLFPSAPEETLLVYHGYIRKFAHFAEYAVLGMLACRTFLRTLGHKSRGPYLIALGLGLLVAGLDEFNQSFNPVRTGSGFDVAIDLTGVVCGVVSFYFLSRKQRSVAAST